jgi:murein DD-endopeptidase MepM/ murein hydrolase activator NlpD
MNKHAANPLKLIFRELANFFEFFFFYIKKKIIVFSVKFEKNKNILVRFFITKRGRHNRTFLHITTMAVLGIGVLVAPFLADTYPIFASQASALDLNTTSAQKQSVLAGDEVFQTNISEKPRDKTLSYTVENGDTLASIAKKYGISADTIRWANNMDSDDLSVGQQLQILPVTGVSHKVEAGETVYNIAKKYDTDPQKIVDFPFNEFSNEEDFALVTGQNLIIPDGVQPEDQPTYTAKQQQGGTTSIARGQVPVSSGGWVFPVAGEISQYASWYHMALDIAGPVGTPVYAAHAGTVTRVVVGSYDTGYGNNVWIDDGDGIRSHYAHLNTATVSTGQSVAGGQLIGTRGNTGRSTGPHTHFEIEVNGSLVNPSIYVHP